MRCGAACVPAGDAGGRRHALRRLDDRRLSVQSRVTSLLSRDREIEEHEKLLVELDEEASRAYTAAASSRRRGASVRRSSSAARRRLRTSCDRRRSTLARRAGARSHADCAARGAPRPAGSVRAAADADRAEPRAQIDEPAGRARAIRRRGEQKQPTRK